MRRRRPGHGDDRRAAELSAGKLVDVGAAELEDLLRSEERLVLVEFWTRGCEPCRELRERLREVAERHGDVCQAVAVEAGEAPEALDRHRVRAFPTLVFFKLGRELHRFRGGALPESTLRLLEDSL